MEISVGCYGNNFIKGINPIIKLLVSVLIFIFSMYSKSLESLFIYMVFLLIFILICGGKEGIVKIMKPTIILSSSIFFISLLFKGGLKGSAIGSIRIIYIFLSTLLFCGTTNPTDLLRTLNNFKVSPMVSIGTLITLRFIPVLKSEMEKIHCSFSLRLGHKKKNLNLMYRGIMIPFVYRMITLSDNLSMSLYMRGFGSTSNPTIYKKVKIQFSDIIFLTVNVIIMITLLWIF